MKVFKFGGASVKDAEGIRNLAGIVGETNDNLIVVVSAFGKTTNALEEILKMWFSGADYTQKLNEVYGYHLEKASMLMGAESETVSRFIEVFSILKEYLEGKPSSNYDYEYDQVVSYGEVWSTLIVSGYLNSSGTPCEWVDIRELLLTDERYRDANILWEESMPAIRRRFNFSEVKIFVTQGFIGGTVSGKVTTLGREGSDYTAAVLANMLEASAVVVWKDVPGILNADPKWKDNTVLLGEISYKEAVEMTFSGAKVIHPKTIKPLHNKSIPLHVRSFINPSGTGTVIKADVAVSLPVPVFVRKEKQILISILPVDFSFVMGDNLGVVFHSFSKHSVKVNLVQASAVSIIVCADDERDRINALIKDLETEYKAIYNDNAELFTIRHYTDSAISEITANREILLEQRTRRTVRFVLR